MSQTAEILRLSPATPDLPEWESKIDLIRRTVATGATADELDLFFHQARRAGLDPLAKQIYYVKRQGKGTIQVGIDGLRLIADRTGKYAGSDDIVYGPEDENGRPAWARATIYKMVAGKRCPFVATTRWSEYYPGDQQGFQWKRMPFAMLGKTAEALALRKGFPADMSGLFIEEEMDQAGKADAVDADYKDLSTQTPTATPANPAVPAPRPVDVGLVSVDDLDTDGIPLAAKRGGQSAFGYTPTKWPLPKMWATDCTPDQIKIVGEKLRERNISDDEATTLHNLVLAEYGLAPGTTKAKLSLFIDWLLNADDNSLKLATDKKNGQKGLEL